MQPVRRIYHIKATIIDLETEEAESVREINFSNERGRDFLNRLIFSCINEGKGLAIELDRKEVEPVDLSR